jgi:hypothetical protein
MYITGDRDTRIGRLMRETRGRVLYYAVLTMGEKVVRFPAASCEEHP